MLLLTATVIALIASSSAAANPVAVCGTAEAQVALESLKGSLACPGHDLYDSVLGSLYNLQAVPRPHAVVLVSIC